jgi:hypothetical protein
MAVLVRNILTCIREFDVNAHLSTFELLKEKTICDYRNRRFQVCCVCCVCALKLLVYEALSGDCSV